MEYSLSTIEQAVCEVGEISLEQLRSRKKAVLLNSLRGIFCFMAMKGGIHPTLAGERLERSRGNVINQAKRYKGYLDSKDKYITMLYTVINDRIQRYATNNTRPVISM